MILSEVENSQAKDVVTADPDPVTVRSLSWTFQPMAGGGAVVLLEDITERRNAEARITHLARYDELTALPNRLNFRDEINAFGGYRIMPTNCRHCCLSTSISSAGQRHPGSSLR